MAPAGALILVLLLATGCREAKRPPGSSPSAPPSPPTAISGRGVGCLAIGFPLAALPPECRIVGDRIVPGPEGSQERRVDVVVGADTVAATVVGDSIWRLDVVSRTLRTHDGLGVGSPAAELLARAGSRIIGGEGRLFVTLPDECGLSFEVGAVPRELLALPPERAAERMPDTATIERVLVFGCEGRT